MEDLYLGVSYERYRSNLRSNSRLRHPRKLGWLIFRNSMGWLIKE
jgi:hypothetical protein